MEANLASTATENQYQDEIDLIDLFKVLWQRRKILLGVLAAFILLGVAATMLLPPKYEYKATVEIGTHIVGQNAVPIDSAETVLSKVKDGYIPKAVSEIVHKVEDLEGMEVGASIPKNANVITLSAKASEAKADYYIDAMNRALAALIADHARIIDLKKQSLQLDIKRKKANILDIDNQIKNQQAELERLNQHLEQTRSYIEKARALVFDSGELVDEAVRSTKSEPSAMTMLLIDGQRKSAMQWLSSLEDRVLSSLNKRDDITAKISEWGQKKSIITDEIELLKAQKKNILQTRVVYGPASSLKRVDLSGIKLILLATFVGLFAGIMAAFLAEFAAKARERLA